MNDELIPDWIKSIKNSDDAVKGRERSTQAQDLVAELTVQKEGPKFWKQLCKDLEISAHALSKIGITATCTCLSEEKNKVLRNNPLPQHGVRIEMKTGSLRFKVDHVIIWYTEGTYYLSLYRREDEEKRIPLGLNESGEVCALIGNDMLDSEQTTEAILRPLVNYLRS